MRLLGNFKLAAVRIDLQIKDSEAFCWFDSRALDPRWLTKTKTRHIKAELARAFEQTFSDREEGSQVRPPSPFAEGAGPELPQVVILRAFLDKQILLFF